MDLDSIIAGVMSSIGIAFFWFEISRLMWPANSMAIRYPNWIRTLLDIPESSKDLTHQAFPGHRFTDREFSRAVGVRSSLNHLIRHSGRRVPEVYGRKFYFLMNLFSASAMLYAVTPYLVYGTFDYNSPASSAAATLMFLMGGFIVKAAADHRIRLIRLKLDHTARKMNVARDDVASHSTHEDDGNTRA